MNIDFSTEVLQLCVEKINKGEVAPQDALLALEASKLILFDRLVKDHLKGFHQFNNIFDPSLNPKHAERSE